MSKKSDRYEKYKAKRRKKFYAHQLKEYKNQIKNEAGDFVLRTRIGGRDVEFRNAKKDDILYDLAAVMGGELVE